MDNLFIFKLLKFGDSSKTPNPFFFFFFFFFHFLRADARLGIKLLIIGTLPVKLQGHQRLLMPDRTSLLIVFCTYGKHSDKALLLSSQNICLSFLYG